MFHRIRDVYALQNHTLCIQFSIGVTKLYCVEPLFDKWEVFRELRDDNVFQQAVVDIGGYGVIWNERIDLSCDELWENGTAVDTPFDDLLAFSDATILWGLNESTLRKAVSYGKLKAGQDVCKFGKQWVVTRSAMLREYGEPK